MRDFDINGHEPSGALCPAWPSERVSPPGPTKGEEMAWTALQLNNTYRQRRHPSFVLPRVVRPAQKVLPSLDWIRRHYWGVTHQHRQVEHQRTTNEEGKIRCMRSRSCFWWPPTGNQFNPALQSVSICLISCSVSVTSECKRREENRNLLMVCGFAL
jgi:hypothetical protein